MSPVLISLLHTTHGTLHSSILYDYCEIMCDNSALYSKLECDNLFIVNMHRRIDSLRTDALYTKTVTILQGN